MSLSNQKESDKKTVGHGAYLILGKPEVLGSIQIARRYDLDRPVMLLSTHKEADVFLIAKDETYLSVVLFYHPSSGWMFENQGARGTVLLNGYPSEERRLKDGDLLQVGETVFHFLEGVGIFSGIYEQLFTMVNQDLLTGAYTKRYFWHMLDEWISLANRSQSPLSLLMIDVDHFKAINDFLGHLGGDAVLQAISSKILERLRKGDIFSRYAGDEFTVILPNTHLASAKNVAEQIRKEICSGPILYKDQEVFTTLSIGVAEYQRGMTKEIFQDTADKLAYQAKTLGKNRIQG